MSISPAFRRTFCVFRLLAVILVIAASPVRAAVGVWSPLGPDGAGVSALALHPTNPRILYAGTDTSGVFKSVDGGATWRLSSTGLGLSPYVWISDLVIERREPDTVYAATLVQGVFRSEDGGRSWAPASRGLPQARGAFEDVRSLIPDPRSPRTLYAGTLGGVFRSTDGGRTWKPRRSGLPVDTWFNALALDPSSGTLYTGTESGRIFRSEDQGKSWKMGSGIPDFNWVLSLVIDPRAPRRLLAGTLYGLFRSADSGRSWKRAGGSLFTNKGIPALLFQSSRVVYAGTYSSGVFRSEDGGATWTAAAEIADPTVLSLAAGRQAIYAGTFGRYRPGGVFRSLDRGATWEPLRRGLSTLPVQDIAFDPSDPDLLVAGIPFLGLARSSDGGASWSVTDPDLLSDGTIDVTSVVIDPAHPSTIYAASRLNGPVLRSDDGGESWQVFSNPPLSFEDLALDPAEPGALWAAGKGGLYHSDDEGATWVRRPLQPEEDFQLQDVQADPRDPRILYASGAALNDYWPPEPVPRVFRSADGGQTWERRDTGITAGGRVVDLALDPVEPATLYAIVSGGGYLFRSTDAGISWTLLPYILPESDLTALATVPSSPPALYVAKLGAGVLRSTDHGETWTPVRLGLGRRPVLVLRPDPHDPERLFAGTGNGGIFTYTAPAGE